MYLFKKGRHLFALSPIPNHPMAAAPISLIIYLLYALQGLPIRTPQSRSDSHPSARLHRLSRFPDSRDSARPPLRQFKAAESHITGSRPTPRYRHPHRTPRFPGVIPESVLPLVNSFSSILRSPRFDKVGRSASPQTHSSLIVRKTFSHISNVPSAISRAGRSVTGRLWAPHTVPPPPISFYPCAYLRSHLISPWCAPTLGRPHRIPQVGPLIRKTPSATPSASNRAF